MSSSLTLMGPSNVRNIFLVAKLSKSQGMVKIAVPESTQLGQVQNGGAENSGKRLSLGHGLRKVERRRPRPPVPLLGGEGERRQPQHAPGKNPQEVIDELLVRSAAERFDYQHLLHRLSILKFLQTLSQLNGHT